MSYKKVPILVLLIVLLFSLTALAATSTKLGSNAGNAMELTLSQPITITSPQGGDVWQGGTNQTISWKYSPTSFKAQTVKILLLKGDTVVSTIVASTSVGAHGSGSFQLGSLIKSTLPGTYRIKIIGNDMTAMSRTGAQFNISDQFTISEPAKITITFPTSNGQTFVPGQQVTITWDYTGDLGSTLYLRLVHRSDPPIASLFAVNIDDKAPVGSGGHGSYNWVIPDKVDGADIPTSATYSFDIGNHYASVGAMGKEFKINAQRITTTVPNTNTQTTINQHLSNPGEKVGLNPQPEPPREIKR